MNRKMLLIGLDGADWRLVRPWIEQGKLPTLAKLTSEGVSGKLRSTIRPESSVAWTSLSTGVNPGKHGLFGFAKWLPDTYTFKINNATDIHIPRFWDLLGNSGKKVGIINMPMTYPVTPVNGFCISGMLTPGTDAEFTYPPTLKKEILKLFPYYLIDVHSTINDKPLLQSTAEKFTRQQIEITLRLMKQYNWDFLSVIFTATDRLQHFLWADMEDTHPFHNSATTMKDAILDLYRIIDEGIGKIISEISNDTLVIILSDHGFNGVARRFYVNTWLEQHGYLKIKSRRTRSKMILLSRASATLRSLPWLRRLKKHLIPPSWTPTRLYSHVLQRNIDWSKTYVYSGMDGGIRLNLNGREPAGIVKPSAYKALRRQLIKDLLAIKNPENREPVLRNIFKREELYHGEITHLAPDLLLEPYREKSNATLNVVLDHSLDPGRKDCIDSSLPYSGNHTLDGIFIAWGNLIDEKPLPSDSQLTDIAPTVLAYYGIIPPEYMDGKILPIFRKMAAATTAATISAQQTNQTTTKNTQDQHIIEQRLHDLGYLN